MTNVLSLMTDDHRRCDEFLAAAEQALAAADLAAASAAFSQFQVAMLAHFACEENALFPAFEVKTGIVAGPTRVMRLEHAQMRELLQSAAESLAAGREADYFEVVETLLILMQQHNMKEENILYPMCDQHLASDLPQLLPVLRTGLCCGGEA